LDVTTGVISDLFQAEWVWHPSWSPDSEHVVFDWSVEVEGMGPHSQIWVINADGTGLIQLTFEGENCCPVWMP
jgi:Tol biopolymer transport system component